MHETLRRLHGGERGPGIVLDRFRLNAVVTQLAFAGRRGRVYRQIIELSGVRPGDSVLDVGCSSGYLAWKMAAAAGPGGRVTGVDPSQAAIGYARQHASDAITFTVGVAQELPLPDASFDVVVSILAIHHVPARKRAAALAEMFRVTRPGGRLLIADINPARPPLPLHPAATRTRRAAATVGPLEELATPAGYQIESTGTLPLLRYIVAVRSPEPATP